MQKTETNTEWYSQLDGLRGLAVLAVMLSHWLPENRQLGLPLGTGGVQLFFVLSGFLITAILLRCREANNKLRAIFAFYVRRALRIFPLYLAVLLTTTGLGIIPLKDTFPWHFLYLSNILFFYRNEWGGSASHFWSLAVEEQFYLLWPFAVLFCPKKFLSYLPFALFFTGIFARFALHSVYPDSELWSVLLPANLTSLALGAIIAVKPAAFGRTSPYLIPVLLLIALSLRSLRTSSWILMEIEFNLMLLAFALVTYQSTVNTVGIQAKILSNRILVYFGTISYGLYLLHNFAWFPLQRLAKYTGLVQLNEDSIAPLALLVVTTCGAGLSWIILEKPLLALKSYFPYSNSNSNSNS